MSEDYEDSPPTELPPLYPETPERIGPYTILRRLGEGGMGEVYEAEQTEPMHRKVALKIIKWGMDTKQVVARFESERQALALMSHPNVAHVLDGGATEQGRPYFVMELVRGVPLTKYCTDYRLSIRERLELFVQVCEGVQHAHQKGVIHRDLKPSNVLVSVEEGHPVPKLIDFGVAKATVHRLTESTLCTELGQLVGTPEYMSPEQAGASSLDVDTRTDVYSLGLLLYELLVGTLPFDPQELRRSAYDEMCRKIREDEPARPSSRFATLGEEAEKIAETRRTDVRSLTRELKHDLDWITMRALEKDRTRRYASASGLAADVERYLGHQPVKAGPPSSAYRLRKFVKRHRVGVTAGTVVVVALLIGILGSTVGLVRALRAEQRATREAETARQVSEFLVEIFEVSDPNAAKGRDISAREILDRGATRVRDELEEQPLVQARLMDSIGRVHSNLGYFDEARGLFETALGIRERELGPDHLDVARTLHNLGSVAAETGEVDKARPLYERALAIREGRLGPDHPDVAQTLNRLANLHHDVGDYDAARSLYERALGILELGGRDAERAESLNDLAVLFQETGDYAAARPLYERALEAATAAYGADSPDASDTVHNLGTLLFQTGDYEAALPLFEQSQRISEKSLGPHHPDVGDCANNLGILHNRLGNYDEARRHFERALNIAEISLGPDHPDTADALNNLANLLVETNDLAGARPLYERALAIREAALEADHPAIGDSYNAIATLLWRTGNPAEAEDRFRRALQIRERALGSDHPKTASSLNNLANLLRDSGKLAAARPLYERALSIREKTLGPDHTTTAGSLHDLACLLRDAGDPAAAKPLFLRALTIREARLGADHPRTSETRSALAGLD